jgi:two-component system sensor histidine kinase CpxA
MKRSGDVSGGMRQVERADRPMDGILNLSMKVFLLYWLGAGVVIVVMNWVVPDHFRRTELLREALNSSLHANASLVADAYERQGCAATQEATALAAKAGDMVLLATPSGALLCGSLSADNLRPLLVSASRSHNIAAKQYGLFQILALAVESRRGNKYVVALKSMYSEPPKFSGWIEGSAALSTSVVVTALLSLLLIRPINRLRSAANGIAAGNLNARVRWGRASKDHVPRDAVGRLIHDFNDMADRLQALVDAQKMLLRDVSHELRAPLARLSIGLELARDEATEPIHQHLDRIEWESARINKLIGELLSLSYMQSVQEILHPVVLSLTKLINELLPDLRYEAEARNRQISATLAKECYMRGDAGLLRQAVENVVRNAIQYAPKGGVIHVELRSEMWEGERLALLRVSDGGPGVPEIELGAILRPFYRVDEPRQKSTAGFGVGLAIADRAVRLHLGQIVARNRPEGGLMVEISLPLVTPAETEGIRCAVQNNSEPSLRTNG